MKVRLSYKAICDALDEILAEEIEEGSGVGKTLLVVDNLSITIWANREDAEIIEEDIEELAGE